MPFTVMLSAHAVETETRIRSSMAAARKHKVVKGLPNMQMVFAPTTADRFAVPVSLVQKPFAYWEEAISGLSSRIHIMRM